MNLRPYLDSLPHGGIAEFAKSIDVSSVYLLQLAAGLDGREPSPSRCVLIERASDGMVTRKDLRRDWAAIWPELATPKPEAEAKS